MTLAAVAPLIEYLENGVSLTHQVPFQFGASTEIAVVRTDPDGLAAAAVLGADFSVSGGAGATGEVTMAAARPVGWTLAIRRVTLRAQEANFSTGDSFPAETLEAALDRPVAIVQEIESELVAQVAAIDARTLKTVAGQTTSAIDLDLFAGRFIGVDADRELIPLSGTGNDLALRVDLADPDVGAALVATGKQSQAAWNRNHLSVLEEWDPDDGIAALPAALATCFTRARGVILPREFAASGLSVALTVPNGKDMVFDGGILTGIPGAAGARIDVAGTSEIRFVDGGRIDEVYLRLQAGSPRLFDLRSHANTGHDQVVLIKGTGTWTDLLIQGGHLENVNYGIARFGWDSGSSTSQGACLGGRIDDLTFRNSRGDAICLDRCVLDRHWEICNNKIDLLDSGPTPVIRRFWGMGICVAGLTGDAKWADAVSFMDFTIHHNRVRNTRHALHAEWAKRGTIADNEIHALRADVSTGSELEVAAIAVYACRDLEISQNTIRESVNEANILLGGVAITGDYVANANVTVAGNVLANGSIVANVGLTQDGAAAELPSFSRIEDNDLRAGSLVIIGRCTETIVNRNRLRLPRIQGAALSLTTQGVGDYRDAARATVSELIAHGNDARDEYGADSATLFVANHDRVEGIGNNFALGGNHPQVNRRFYSDGGGGLGYGVEFVAGDVHVDSSDGAQRLLTAGGSRVPAGDTFQVVDASTIKAVGAGRNWLTEHRRGQRVTLDFDDATPNLVTTIVRTRQTGGFFYMTVSHAIVAAAAVTGTVLATNTPTAVRIDGELAGSATWNPPNLASGATQSTTVTVTGAAIGDHASASFSLALAGTRLWAEVTAADTVTVYQRNDTGGAVDLASGTLRAKVRRA